MEDFYRIRRLPPYVFESVNRAKAAARNGGADIIDLGMGNPDLPAPAHVVDKLKEVVGKSRTDRYSASKGIPGLRRAQAAYYGRRFGVKLNPDTQVVTTLGSKEGFANVAQAITAPGDIIIVPNPTYPIHVFGFLMAGGAIRSVPVEANEAFFGALERAVLFSIPKPIAVVVCYPSNPTACVATLDFYRDLIAFAKIGGEYAVFQKDRRPDGADDDRKKTAIAERIVNSEIKERAKNGHGSDRDQDAEPVWHPQIDGQHGHRESAQHGEIALGEIDHVGRTVDQYKAQSHQANKCCRCQAR